MKGKGNKAAASSPPGSAVELILERTTQDRRKIEYYSDDVNFIETALQLGEAETHLTNLSKVTAIVFKPDAIVARAMSPAVTFLRDRGFVPIAAETFAYDRNMIRNAWRYQINIATLERLRVVDYLLAGREALYLLLRDNSFDAGEHASASSRLNSLKGPAEVEGRTAECLRSVLGDHNTFLNKVHIPDDTADLLREMSIYFDYESRVALLDTANAGGPELTDLGSRLSAAEVRQGSHDFDIRKVLNSMRAAVRTGPLPADACARLLAEIDRLDAGGALDDSAIHLLRSHRSLFQDWDVAVLFTQFVIANRPGADKLL